MNNDKKDILVFNSPGLFIPAIIRGIISPSAPTGMLSLSSVSDRNIGSTSSFRYDVAGVGLRSTQQIEIDYASFENHIFFQSARVATNLAFDKIIQNYPFDGTKKEVEQYIDSLTGYEKYILDQFPKNKGYLFFSSSYIKVDDFAGSLTPLYANNNSGESVLDPEDKSFSLEMWFYSPSVTNDNQTICQKISGSNQGFSLFVSQSSSTTSASIVFHLISGSNVLTASSNITKGTFNHLVATYNKDDEQAELFINEQLLSTSSVKIDFGLFDFKVSPLYIGSGSTAGSFIPQQNLSGALDELRIFHSRRTIEQQKLFKTKNIFGSDDLVLYYKFNEPTGSLGGDDNDRIVLDYSGNSLYALIENYVHTLRNTSSINVPMTNEKLEFNPVLFPNYDPLVDLNSLLLTSASYYDASNPNIITRLIPSHYLLEGQSEEGLISEDGTIIDVYTGESVPGSGEVGQAQIIQTILFIWAKFFDELKIVLDSFSKSININYSGENSTPDQLLVKVAEFYGISLPNLFSGASFEQFIDAENLDIDIGTSENSLKTIQNKIWRRILVNIRDILESKGTIHSVKSFIRTLGIDPDSNFRIREYGGPTRRNLSGQRETGTEVAAMLDMSGSSSVITSPYLSSSRTEVGFPTIDGTFVSVGLYNPHGISNDRNDGLLTSGSFSLEGIYKFPKNRLLSATTQSLMRMHISSSNNQSGLLFNVVAFSGSIESDKKVKIFVKPGGNDYLQLEITGVDIFDGDKWGVSAGRFRNDDPSDYLEEYPSLVKSNVSSSYFLYIGKPNKNLNIERLYQTQSFFQESNSGIIDNFKTISSDNLFGSYIIIGSSSIPISSSFLNNTSSVSSDARTTIFNGLVSNVRFWSKGLIFNEWKEHIRNFKSLGVIDPKSNFNFDRTQSGSFGRIRIDISMDQIITSSNSSGEISIFDFSQNNFHFSGTLFESSKQVINPEIFYYSHLSPKFDEASTTNKVRARGYQDLDLANNRMAEHGLVHFIDPNDSPNDDVRFSIDFNLINYLDQDIINIFATFESLDNILGKPELQFSPDYPDLENLRKIYFNRLTEKINLKSFFEFFKWFDANIGNFISALLPRKTKFRGVNFIIESHMLERPKFENLNNDQYLTIDTERNSSKGVILMQLLDGFVKKY